MSGMTREEAIRLLGVIDAICTMQMGDYGEREHSAILMAIADMEKQIPKKVVDFIEHQEEFSSYYYLAFKCPSCEGSVVGQPYRPKYCKKCGQALDWSEEND